MNFRFFKKPQENKAANKQKIVAEIMQAIEKKEYEPFQKGLQDLKKNFSGIELVQALTMIIKTLNPDYPLEKIGSDEQALRNIKFPEPTFNYLTNNSTASSDKSFRMVK